MDSSRESKMVVLRRDDAGRPSVWCDPEIADLVQALNDGGIPTVASCSGHGFRPGSIALADGRWLVIAKDDDERRKIDALFPVDINGSAQPEAQQQQGNAGAITDADIAKWESERGNGMTSAVGEYTPKEFWLLLDEVKRLRTAPPSAPTQPEFRVGVDVTRDGAQVVVLRCEGDAGEVIYSEMHPLPAAQGDVQPLTDEHKAILNAWRAAFVAERAMRYREGGMAIEQARIHAETDAARMAVSAAAQQPVEGLASWMINNLLTESQLSVVPPGHQKELRYCVESIFPLQQPAPGEG